jgi:putative membrane protein
MKQCNRVFMKHTLYIVLVWLLAGSSAGITSCGSNNQNNNPIAEESKDVAEENNENKFNSNAAERNAQLLVDLAVLGHSEIEMAKIAKQKSGSKTIKNLAASLQADHMLLMKQLKQIAANRNISTPDSASAQDKKEAMDLTGNKPGAFDKRWCTEVLHKHESMIAAMEDGATTATDPGLRAWINDALPKIRMHRDKLMQLKYTLR